MARELGWKSVALMRDGLSNAEYRQWITFYRYEAWQQEHAAKAAEL